MMIFCLDQATDFSTALTAELGLTIAPHEERLFSDGERKLRPLVDPRGSDAYVIHSLHGGPTDSPHDKLCCLLMFMATLRAHGADRVTAVVPYLAYARKDQQTKPHDPLSLRFVAQMFEAMGVAQVIVIEVHNVAAFQNAFRCVTGHLQAHGAFNAVAQEVAKAGPIAVASPDPGGVKRAQLWRESLEDTIGQPVGFAMVDKRRSAGEVSSSNLVAGQVDGTTVLLLDDLIASGETMVRAAKALRQAGARRVMACAAHGLFVDQASSILLDESISQVVITDSVPPFRVPPDSSLRQKLRIVSCAAMAADALRLSHEAWAC